MTAAISQGAPFWADANAADIAGDQDFYTGLFGWTPEDLGPEMGHYRVMSLPDGRHVAGLAPNRPESPDSPAVWTLSFKVADCAASTTLARDLGGSVVMGITDLGDLTFSLVEDPQGEMFGIVEHGGGDFGFQASHERSAPVWFSYGAPGDPVDAMRYYIDLFGWRSRSSPMPDGGTILEMTAPEESGAFCSVRTVAAGESPHWTVFWGAESVPRTVDRAVALGGSVVVPASPSPASTWAVLASPAGSVFGVMD
ncbi:VOC family protein [Salininema proteolyticum]|uniref:VOC family protein n=1 Tax=Salininema proteolyticum TaxID=1607685 RepID=A0ABV8TXF5_9ACTN